MTLKLPHVTIWTCCWTQEPERIDRHLRVLKYCQSIIECKRIVFVSAVTVPTPPGIELVPLYAGPGFNWNTFVNREVPRLITDGFAMSVHEDGFPIRPDLWSDDFLKYDYIGAPWTDDVVGNGGFNIESQTLLREKSLVPSSQHDGHNSDVWVCRIHRARFESRGVIFAPCDIAARFSTESPTPQCPGNLPSFGFHGRRAAPEKYAEGWRLIEEFERAIPASHPIKVAVVYIYAPQSKESMRYTKRFLESYQSNPPGIDHDTVVVLGGCKISAGIRRLFNLLPNLQFLEHDNSGWDIGGFQHAARAYPCDMMVFFGASTYFQRPGWLVRMRTAFLKHGNAQYGTMGNRGNLSVKVWPHIRTTAFWMNPELLNSYPIKVTRPEERFPFEHGKECFTVWVAKQDLKSWVVTWTNELLWRDWNSDPNGYSRGDQSSMLAGDRVSEPPYFKLGKYNPVVPPPDWRLPVNPPPTAPPTISRHSRAMPEAWVPMRGPGPFPTIR